MKPRLFKLQKLWYCAKPGTLAGLGYTFTDAYTEWLARNGMRKIHAHESCT